MALFVSTDHMDQKAICIVSYPVYYHHSYPAARIWSLLPSLPYVLVPVTFKFVAFFACLAIAHVGLAFYSNNVSFERATLQR